MLHGHMSKRAADFVLMIFFESIIGFVVGNVVPLEYGLAEATFNISSKICSDLAGLVLFRVGLLNVN